MRYIIGFLALLVIATGPCAAGLEDFSQPQMNTGLKDALTQGAANAVARLGRENGFLENPRVKIPLPSPLDKGEKLLRAMGMGKQADELIVAMNRAAEAAVPEAKTLLVDAVKKMSVQDAKNILTGGDDAATAYFRRSTEDALRVKFKPIVVRATEKVGLAQQYNSLVEKAAVTGLAGAKPARVEDHVTQKALDGLYLVMAEEEKALRKDPVKAGSDLAKKIFGALK